MYCFIYSNFLIIVCIWYIRSTVVTPIHPRLGVMSELLILLQEYDTEKNHHQSRDKKLKTLNFRYQFTIGRTCRQRTFKEKTSFRFKHNFNHNLGVYSVSEFQLADPMIAKTKDPSQKVIYGKARELLRIIDPEYAANDHWVVQVHSMDTTSSIGRHVDAKDITFQYGVTVGEYEGGNLLTWNRSGELSEMNVRNEVVKLDGRLPHSVTPITSGTRYSLYYYKSYDPMINRPTAILDCAEIVKF